MGSKTRAGQSPEKTSPERAAGKGEGRRGQNRTEPEGPGGAATGARRVLHPGDARRPPHPGEDVCGRGPPARAGASTCGGSRRSGRKARRACLVPNASHCARGRHFSQETEVLVWVPLLEIASLQPGVYLLLLPAPFSPALPRGLPVCTFFFRRLILTQKIAGFDSFARWLRKEQLTVSAKCLCQSPKQPIPINVKRRTDLLTGKCEMMG